MLNIKHQFNLATNQIQMDNKVPIDLNELSLKTSSKR